MTTAIKPPATATTEWKFPPPMVLAWKTPEFMPSLTRQPLFKAIKSKKRVRFTTVTTFVFPLAHGGSAVPKDQGPPIGLASTHSKQECQLITEAPISRRGRVRKFTNIERMTLLKKAGYSRNEVAQMCLDVIDVCKSRLETEDVRLGEPTPPSKRRKL
ncbi:Aste57867_6261 [Aphanomyces stellatus]|uniref:Aste57867_2816 protein n=1 Tax=Aphanomyces stellatus TaxID=120398 RepID=A0A485KCM9_9STRA|nr:hypothetical protein As57867_006247 [Aphanomyces stellatus]KAF0716489.1 hypothetical protein As57867_002809 [Aphanomyces stellatus]KAF0716496.1 hypothetical protein As57867_002816 [Aphanomyces stellatus]VFT80004.1 Aste57867_2816 [Aphanomyces stellatus]VFT80011.1 Aste57867_2823 [Aphanomyces stellatus]